MISNKYKNTKYNKIYKNKIKIYIYTTIHSFLLLLFSRDASLVIFITLQNIYISNKYCCFELSIHKKKNSQKYYAAQLFLSLMIIRGNVFEQ